MARGIDVRRPKPLTTRQRLHTSDQPLGTKGTTSAIKVHRFMRRTQIGDGIAIEEDMRS